MEGRKLRFDVFAALLLAVFILKAQIIHWPQVEGMEMAGRQKMEFQCQNRADADSTIGGKLTKQKLKQLKLAIERNPLEIWFFKNRFKSVKDLFITLPLWDSARGVVQRFDTTNRLRDVILRSLNGEDVNVAIMGGSISAGGGLTLDNEDLRGIYYRVFRDWWQKTVEPITGSVLQLNNLAIGGTGSNFFAFCYNVFLNPNSTMNLALLDFTVNDYIQLRFSRIPMTLPLEQLTREILNERTSPAVMYVNFVQGESQIPLCNNLENHGQTMLALNYGITTVSLRNFFCSSPLQIGKKFPSMFTSDGNHVSIIGHAQVAYMIINHMRQLMLSIIDNVLTSEEVKVTGPTNSLPSEGDIIILPDCPLKFRDLPGPVSKSYQQYFRDHPLCYTMMTPDLNKNMSMSRSLQVREIGNIGFDVVQRVPINKKGSAITAVIQPYPEDQIQPSEIQRFRTDAYGGWQSHQVNSILELEILVPLTSFSKKGNLESTADARHFAIAVRTGGYGGTAKVWLNEYEERGVLVNTRSPFGHTKVITIARHVIPGRHVLNVRTVTEGIFILSGVVIGPTYK